MNKILQYILSILLISCPAMTFGQEQLVKSALKGSKRLFRTEAKSLAKEGVEAANKSLMKDAFRTGSEEIGKNYMKEASAKQLIRGAVRKKVLKEIEEKEFGSILHYGMINARKEVVQTEKSSAKVALSKEAHDKTYNQSLQKIYEDAFSAKKKTIKVTSKSQTAKKDTKDKTLKDLTKKEARKIVLSREFKSVEELIAFLKKENPKLATYVERMNYYWGGKGSEFMKFIVYEKTADGKIILRNSKYTKSEILLDGNKVYAKAGNVSEKNGELNLFLANRDKMMPNMIYIVDDGAFIYKTDKLGRVVETNTDLKKASMVKRSSKRGSQAHNCAAKGGRKGDHGGHLIASEINGPEEAINIVPMSAKFNTSGKWRQLEEEIKRLMDSGKDVKVKQIIKYKGSTSIPEYIEVHVSVDGVDTVHRFKL